MGELTERGEIVAAGGAQLADQNGDDTLKPLDQSDARGDSPDVETERQDPGAQDPPAEGDPAPGPADIPAPPVVETADDQDAGARENR